MKKDLDKQKLECTLTIRISKLLKDKLEKAAIKRASTPGQLARFWVEQMLKDAKNDN